MSERFSIIKSPEEFFNELVESSVNQQGLGLDQQLRAYLVYLLSENVDPETLLKKNKKHPYADQALILTLKQAQSQINETNRQMLKYVGDYCLYVTGYFNESLKRKIVNASYYTSIGGEAFRSLSFASRKSSLSSLYYDIFKNFIDLVNILKNVSIMTVNKDDTYLLKKN